MSRRSQDLEGTKADNSRTESKNSSQHNQSKKAHRNGYARITLTNLFQPNFCRYNPTHYSHTICLLHELYRMTQTQKNKLLTIPLQNQEAKDLPIPLSQRHRSQVPTEPQACAARNDEGVEGGQGGKAGCCLIVFFHVERLRRCQLRTKRVKMINDSRRARRTISQKTSLREGD